MKKTALLFLALISSPFVNAHANTQWFIPKNIAVLDDFRTYQIGTEWGKIPVTEEILQNATPAFLRAAYATVKVGGGTGFYLGKFGKYHVIGTNNHVCPAGYACLNQAAKFALLKREFKITKFFGTFKNIDTSILGIEVPAQDEALLAPYAKNFAFKKDLYHQQPLVTVGFGIGNNPKRVIVANQDEDCTVFSDNAEYRYMKDPDELNPGENEVWSFANGCDVSHGDSGSAMVDRITSEVMGIIWTGRIPKDPRVQTGKFVAHLKANPKAEEIWTQLSYGVPAVKIGEFLYNATQSSTISAETRQLYLNMLDTK